MVDKKEIGTALMVAGVFITFVAVAFPQQIANSLGTIGVDTTPPTISGTNPYSSDKSSPDQLTPGKQVNVYIWVYDSGSGFSRISGSSGYVWVNINGTKHGLTFEKKQSCITGGYDYKYSTTWTPSSTDKLYAFEWHAMDMAGNERIYTTYGKTTSKPAGILTANGKQISGVNGTVWFKTKNFTFKTKVTQGASIVTSVSLVVDGNSHTMSRVSGTDNWKYSTTLSEGTHDVKTVVNWSAGSVTVQGVTVNIGGKGQKIPMPNESLILAGFGAFLVCIGAIARFRPETFWKRG